MNSYEIIIGIILRIFSHSVQNRLHCFQLIEFAGAHTKMYREEIDSGYFFENSERSSGESCN